MCIVNWNIYKNNFFVYKKPFEILTIILCNLYLEPDEVRFKGIINVKVYVGVAENGIKHKNILKFLNSHDKYTK